jgi:hypothetical protein
MKTATIYRRRKNTKLAAFRLSSPVRKALRLISKQTGMNLTQSLEEAVLTKATTLKISV